MDAGACGGLRFAATWVGQAIRSMFRYKLRTPIGDDIGEATHRFLLEPGEVLTIGDNQRFRVLDVTPIEEKNFDIIALVHVEAAR
jgi:hypothetical protein